MMVLAAGAVCAPSEGALSPRIVQTQYGALRGIIDRLGNNGIGLQPVERFLGVPYATAPVNGLRFMPPITPSPWDGVRTADRPAPRCPGRPPPSDDAPVKYLTSRANASSSEDCLYLNVFYPTFSESVRTLFTRRLAPPIGPGGDRAPRGRLAALSRTRLSVSRRIVSALLSVCEADGGT